MRRPVLFLAIITCLLCVGLGVAWFVGGDAGGNANVVLESDGTLVTTEDVASSTPLGVRTENTDGLPAPAEPLPASAYDTTLEIFLDLVRPAGWLHAEGSQALGSGASSALVGGLWNEGNSVVRGSVRFVSGANEGRVLDCDAGGRFGANDLYPGLSVVEVTGPGIPGSLREMILRNDRETRLNIGYGRLSTVNGEVYDQTGKPVEGATVRMDGVPAQTNDFGRFQVAGIAGSHGDMVVTVEKEGYATLRTKLSLMSGTTVPLGTHRFVLQEAGSLEVYVVEKIGATGPAQLYLMPANPMMAQSSFAWHRRNPISIEPGTSTVIDGLPPGEVRALVFHAGANAKPRIATAIVKSGQATPLTIHLEPAPMLAGKVTHDGAPVARAIVRVEAPDRTRAMLNYLGESAAYLESQVMQSLPPGVQAVKTDDFGNFRIGLFGDATEVKYITATSFDGKLWAGQVLRPGTTEVELELDSAREGNRELLIEISDRELPLRVDLMIDGTPQGMTAIQPGEHLRVPGLMEGDWKLTARFGRTRLFDEVPITVQVGAAFYIGLPQLERPGEGE
ncbi:MAG: carboxypeptidase regulatory-like domain-containing protein [Planctomycetes bacterium]|nr:carboxypeptidase regulatory-like domain-containing protein [Planctomycetota bacterium]MCB9903376.1 carboxypeptidase regulatory-like domain-containing protein [Planctomycetota bacterium]